MNEFESRKLDTRKYFDTYEFDRIIKLCKSYPNRAKDCFEKYLERYPTDLQARIQYASILITLSNYEDAEKELELSKYLLSKKSVFKEDNYKTRKTKHELLYNTLRLYAYQNKANEFLSLYFENCNFLRDVKPDVVFYFRSLVGEKVATKNYMPSYIRSQIIDYSEDRFLDHVKKHDADFNENDREISSSFFKADFPFEKVLEEAKKVIPSDKKRNRGFYSNVYTFKYDECGRSSNKICNFFRIVTLNNSDHFITMYPISVEEDMEYTDLNYMNEKEEDYSKVKRISMIDRFNKRYGINRGE